MAKILLAARVRTEFGKGAARRTRRDGDVPAVLYGHGADTRHLAINAREFSRAIKGDANAVLTLQIDGDEQLALPRAIVRHPIKDHLVHIDLLSVRRGEKVVVEVPVHLEGEAAPSTLVLHELTTLAIEVDALSIPESLTVSIAGAEVGTLITAADVVLPEGATLAEAGDNLVVAVQAAQAAEVESSADETEDAEEEAPADEGEDA